MRRKPYSLYQEKNDLPQVVAEVKEDTLRSKWPKWLTTVQAAIYLGKFRRSDGEPSVGAIRNLIYRKRLKAHKFLGRCLINRSELDQLIDLSPIIGGG
jgi:hypothetical protein